MILQKIRSLFNAALTNVAQLLISIWSGVMGFVTRRPKPSDELPSGSLEVREGLGRQGELDAEQAPEAANELDIQATPVTEQAPEGLGVDLDSEAESEGAIELGLEESSVNEQVQLTESERREINDLLAAIPEASSCLELTTEFLLTIKKWSEPACAQFFAELPLQVNGLYFSPPPPSSPPLTTLSCSIDRSFRHLPSKINTLHFKIIGWSAVEAWNFYSFIWGVRGLMSCLMQAHFTHANFSHCMLRVMLMWSGKEDMRAFFEGFNGTAVTHLNLSNNGLFSRGVENARLFFSQIPATTPLKSLDLSSNRIASLNHPLISNPEEIGLIDILAALPASITELTFSAADLCEMANIDVPEYGQGNNNIPSAANQEWITRYTQLRTQQAMHLQCVGLPPTITRLRVSIHPEGQTDGRLNVVSLTGALLGLTKNIKELDLTAYNMSQAERQYVVAMFWPRPITLIFSNSDSLEASEAVAQPHICEALAARREGYQKGGYVDAIEKAITGRGLSLAKAATAQVDNVPAEDVEAINPADNEAPQPTAGEVVQGNPDAAPPLVLAEDARKEWERPVPSLTRLAGLALLKSHTPIACPSCVAEHEGAEIATTDTVNYLSTKVLATKLNH